MLSVRSPALARQGAGELEAVHLRTGPGSRGTRAGHGHAMIICTACHDQLRKTTFYEPAHDSGHDPLTGWVMAADPRS